MIQRIVLGVLGGALIALSVFTVGNSVSFSSGVPDNGSAWVVLAAGALVALFSIVRVRTLIGFGAGAAAAVAAAEIYDAARAGDFTMTARLGVLGAGVVVALAATIGRRSKKVVVEPAAVEATPAETAPVAVAPVVAAPVVAAPVVVAPAKRAKDTKASAEQATTVHETNQANIPR